MTKTEAATCCAAALYIGAAFTTDDWWYPAGLLARGAPATLILFGLWRAAIHVRRRWQDSRAKLG